MCAQESHPRQIGADEYTLLAFSESEPEIAETFARNKFGVSLEELGLTPERRANIFKYSRRIRTRVEHHQETHHSLDLGFMLHDIEWFLAAEYDIYSDENGRDSGKARETKVQHDDGSYTITPRYEDRKVGMVKKFMEKNGLCNEQIEGYEDVLSHKPGRIKYLVILRTAFEKDYRRLILKEEE